MRLPGRRLPPRVGHCWLSGKAGALLEERLGAAPLWRLSWEQLSLSGNCKLRNRSVAGRSSEEAGGLGEGLGLDTAPPGASFGAAWAAMEQHTGMGRYRIAGGVRP